MRRGVKTIDLSLPPAAIDPRVALPHSHHARCSVWKLFGNWSRHLRAHARKTGRPKPFHFTC
eukprot:1180780-Prorocentrum_minimum.AAC.1